MGWRYVTKIVIAHDARAKREYVRVAHPHVTHGFAKFDATQQP